jgi:site-specific DNA recombinase
MAEALRGKVDVVLAEALDRFSRDQEDTAGLFKRLTFAGVGIVTLAEGDITFLHIGLKGTMNAMFLKELADKTRRGLRGRVELGKAGGGVCFGYRIVRTFKDGVVSTGEREIVPEEAEIIRRIFRDYVAGISPKQIAKDLNREGLRGPRAALWSPSTISRQPEARHRHPAQRAVHRPSGLEQAALPEGSGHRQARVAAESPSLSG